MKGRASSTVTAHAKRFKWMIDYGLKNFVKMDSNPMANYNDWIKREKKLIREPFTNEEVERLQNVSDPEWALLNNIMSCTGMRIGDALDVGSEYFIKKGEMLCMSLVPKKVGRKVRDASAPLVVPVVAPLLSLVEERTNENYLLPKLRRIPKGKLAMKFREVMDEADVKYVGMYGVV